MKFPISLPLTSTGSDALATLSHPSSAVWELEMHNGADNRLTAHFIETCLYKALDLVEKDWRSTPGAPGALVIIGRKDQQKFFSNGLDYESASSDPGFVPNVHDPFLRRLLGFPLPTIAAINGHAFAFGYIFTLACDYRVMTAGKAWCSLNEIFFGAPFSQSTNALLNYKLSSPSVIRKTTLEGHRWTPQEVLDLGLVEEIAEGGTEGVLKAAHALAKRKADFAKTGVYGLMKKDLSRRIFDASIPDNRRILPTDAKRIADMRL